MNAVEQAKTFDVVSKIASIVNLVKSEFPGVSVDLKPWKDDPDTQDLVDPESIDLGIHFPGRSSAYQSRCILVQIRFHIDPVEGDRRPLGIEALGYDHRGQQWRFSTIENWGFYGRVSPNPEACQQFRQAFRKVYDLFT